MKQLDYDPFELEESGHFQEKETTHPSLEMTGTEEYNKGPDHMEKWL